MNYSKYHFRINQIAQGAPYNWLFLPGGPGLGSEYLIAFCTRLRLKGNLFLIDFPKDGTNLQGLLDADYWKEGLIDLVTGYSNPILVTHSFSGMFALSLPQLEPHLKGLILMNTTTQDTFFQHVDSMRQKHNLPDLLPAASQYHLNPSNETYKIFWETYKHYCFTSNELASGEQMMTLFSFNNDSYHYAIEHFYPNYQSKWHPTQIPAMTLTSEKDFICPPDIFIQDKKYQRTNILNKIIPEAGHCPWIAQFDEVQDCFDEFLRELGS